MGVSREGLLISYPNRVQGKTCLKEFSNRRVREDMPQRSATGISNKWCEILSTTYEARLIYFLTQKLNYGPLGIGGSEKEKPQPLGSMRSAQAHWGPEAEKLKALGSRRSTQVHWGSEGQLKRKEKKTVMDHLGSAEKPKVLGSKRSVQAH
ncbi:Hypothetical predicted protein [Prunus dulcis]|uniref:Uncharacterized protein n=1 Tax=Prunus dulcis TaxID=3755 RepID=A0A5E4EP32_PRUDU|nr:Hypothetical predicted protein [Prunus dulcis]